MSFKAEKSVSITPPQPINYSPFKPFTRENIEELKDDLKQNLYKSSTTEQ